MTRKRGTGLICCALWEKQNGIQFFILIEGTYLKSTEVMPEAGKASRLSKKKLVNLVNNVPLFPSFSSRRIVEHLTEHYAMSDNVNASQHKKGIGKKPKRLCPRKLSKS